MDRQSTDSTGVSNPVVAIALLAAVGGAAFLAWRRAAPLSRYGQNRQSEERDQRGPNPPRNPGTDPI